jgi:sporulation protein YlmC with PRC-barrel domain
MQEGSYMEMETGMPVIDARGERIGHVQEVLADEASGIFHGLAVADPSLRGGTTWCARRGGGAAARRRDHGRADG